MVPLLELIRNPGDNLALAVAREESFKLLDPRWDSESSTDLFYAYLFLRTLLFPVIIVTSLGLALQTRSYKNWAWFSLVLIVGGIYAMFSLSRAPISAIFMRIFFFLYLFFFY